jgi:hypothetical protein
MNSLHILSKNTNSGTKMLSFHSPQVINTIIFTVCLLFISVSINATTYYSRANANWKVASTWSTVGYGGAAASSYPVAGDVVYIGNNNTVTVNAAGACSDLTIESGSTLTVNGYTFTVSGTTTIKGTITHTSTQQTKTFNNVTITSGGVWNSNAGETYPITNLTLAGSTITGSTTGTFNVSGNLSVTSGTTNTLNSLNLSVAGTSAVDGTLNIANTGGSKTFTKLVTVSTSGIINNSVAETLTFNGGLSVNGSVINSGVLNGSGALAFNSGSTYQHSQNGGTIPTATWNVNSTCLITGITSSNTLNGLNQTFGNFTWNCTGQTGTPASSGNMIVNGDFTLSAGRFTLNNSNSYTLTIGGNYVQTAGIFDFNKGTSGTSNVSLKGNFSNTAGSNSITTSGAGAPNGNIIFNGTNQSFNMPTSNAAVWTTYTINSGSKVQLLSNITLYGSNSSGFFGQITVNGTLDARTFTITDTGTTSGATQFNLNSGGTLITANTDGVNGTLPSATTTKSLNASANYIFNGTSAQVTGSLLTKSNNLTVTNPAGVTLSRNVAVSGNLSVLTSGTTLNCDQYQITGNATGTMTMDPGTTLVIGRNTDWDTTDFPTNFTKAHISLDPTSTVIYYGGYRNISATPNYGNLVIACQAGMACVASGDLTVNSNVTINANTTLSLGWTGTVMTVGGNLTDNGTLIFTDWPVKTVTVSGNLSGSGTIDMTQSAHTLNLNGQNNSVGTLTTDGNNSVVNYEYAGAGTQQVFASPNYQSMTISGSAKALQGAATVKNTLTLTSGILTTTATNLLTVSNTAATAIIGGSASSYISGPVNWSVVPGSTYNFPIGSSSTYLPFTLVPTATTTAQIQAYSGSSAGSADGTTVESISSTEYWSMTTGSSISGSNISVSRPAAIAPLNALATASAVNGPYSYVGGAPDTYGVSNATFAGSGTTAYFVMAKGKGTSIWLKADAGTSSVTDGNGVDTWVDQSGISNDAKSQNTAPNYKAIGWNFNPLINFPSGGNGYYLSSLDNIIDDMTFVAVYNSSQNKTGSPWADPTIIGCETNVVNNDYYLSTDNGKPFFKGTNEDKTSPIAANSYNDNLPHIVSVTRKKSTAGSIYLYVDGSTPVSGTSDNTSLSAPKKIGIGNHYSSLASAQFEGGISEIYGVNSVLPVTNLQNFESYLALKYGITIAHDYTNGSGTTIYSVSDHKNNIAGLGSENTSTGGYGLNQQIAVSSNLSLGTASRIVMTTTGNFTDANLGRTQILANGQYLVWGDDNGSISSWTTKGAYPMVARTWKVQNTNVTAPLNFQIDLNPSSFPASASGLYTLLVSTDGSFNSSTTTEYLLTQQSGNLYSASGITFSGGTSYFSIGHPVYSTAVYVREGGKGSQTGTSWANAMPTIQKAVETSNKLTTKLSVYVAAGSYNNDTHYTYTYNSASVNFLMRNGVNVLGGFVDDGTPNNPSGTTTSRLTGAASILNGSYSQVLAPELGSFAATTIWDGFTIKNASSGAYAATIPTNATIQNCKIWLNNGGGLKLLTGATAYNVLVADNSAAGVALTGTAKLVNATIVNNTGAGITSDATTPTITNSILWNNNSGGDNITGTIPLTTNITYTASGASAAFTSNTTGTTGLMNSWASGTGNIELYHRSPNFKDATNATKANRNYELLLISPCLDVNNAAANPLTIDANGNLRTYNGKIDMGAFQKWDGYSTDGTSINAFRSASTYTPSIFASTIATLANQANVELLVPSGITFNIGATPLYTNYLEIQDLSTTSPIIKGGTLNATKALYVRKFTKLRTSGAQAWTFFGVPYDVNVNQIDGGIAENTVRIEQYNENTRALNGANKSAWKPYLTTASTMYKGVGYALQFNNKVPDSSPSTGNTVIFLSNGNVSFSDPGAPVIKPLSYTPSGVSWYDLGWNFISNPFSQIATIEYNTSNYWPLNSSGTADPSVNAYGGGVYTYDTDADSYDIIPLTSFYSRGLAPFAGCFIKNGANIGNIQFKQLASSSNPLKVKSFSDVEQTTSDTAKPMLFHLHASGNSKAGNTYVLFHPNAHAAQVEVEDSPNWSATSNGSNIVLNTFAEGGSLGLGINMLPFTGNSVEVPLQISVPDKGDYTITLPEKDSTLVVYIKDDSGSLTNLNLSAYTFSVADATAVPNFALVFRKRTGSLGENTDSRITFIQGQTNVAVYGLDVMKQLLVYTPTGQLCKQKDLNGYEASIALPSIPGVYLVKIVTNKGSVTKKIINP